MELSSYLEKLKLNPKHRVEIFLQKGCAYYVRRNRIAAFGKGILAVKNNPADTTWQVFCTDSIEEPLFDKRIAIFEHKGCIKDVSCLDIRNLPSGDRTIYANRLNKSFFGALVYFEELGNGDDMALLVMVQTGKSMDESVVILPAYSRFDILNLRTMAHLFCMGLGGEEENKFSKLFMEEAIVDEEFPK